jgi:hypothetical protein
MPSLFVRCMLFVSSYFPLALIFCVLLFVNHTFWAIIILLIGLSGLVVMLLYFLVITPTKNMFDEKVIELQKRDGDVMSYIASYLIPFVTFPLEGWQQITAVLVFIAVLLVVYVNSNMIYINPMLNLIGYHLYEVTLEHSELSHYLVIRHRVVRGERLQLVKIGDGIFLGRRA